MAPQNDSPPQWQTFLDLQNDVKPYLQVPASVTVNDAKLQEFTDTACWWLQDYLGRPIAPTMFFRRFSGWTGLNGSYISLPYYPVLQVISIVEYWGSSGPHTLVEQTPAAQGGGDMYTLQPIEGLIIRSFQGLIQRPFFPGLRNIEVTWQAGYQPVPPPLRMAAKELVQFWQRNTQEAVRVQRPMQEYDPATALGFLPAVPDFVKQMVQPFEQVGIG